METPLNKGDVLQLSVTRMAHGGEGIATAPDGRVVFVRSAYPGDLISAQIVQLKKNFARAELLRIETPGNLRIEQTCPAAAQGAGCCDFGDLNPRSALDLKRGVLTDQLSRAIRETQQVLPEAEPLEPNRGWRTRVRLGVDEVGRAGLRKARSNELVTDAVCSQVVPSLLDGIVGDGARTFTPGAQVVAVKDSRGQRHIVETRRVARGKRVEHVSKTIEGSGNVVESVGDHEFRFPPTAFWQAHTQAPSAYVGVVRSWLADRPTPRGDRLVAWDLYGGVGLFSAAIADVAGPECQVWSVDYSPAAAKIEQPALDGLNVERVHARVERGMNTLPKPDVVVLDPPRTGAGAQVVEEIAAAGPSQVIHIGCDPATFARDLASWAQGGYRVNRIKLIDAFPGTHHFEVLAELKRDDSEA